MAEYTVQAPDGKTITLQGPEGASEQEVIAKAQELYTVEETTWGREFGYNFNKSMSDLNSATIIAEAYMPLGNIYGEDGFRYYSPEELYGKEFMDSDFDTRRQMLVDRNNKQLTEEYADVIASDKAHGGSASARVLGTLTGAVASPTSLAPVGAGYKGIAAMSGLLGAEYSALQQFATKGEIDTGEVVKTAAVSAVAAPALMFAGRKGIEAVKKTYTPDVGTANKTMDVVDQAYGSAAAAGKSKLDGSFDAHVKELTGLSPEDIAKVGQVAGREPVYVTGTAGKLAEDVAALGTDVVARITKPGINAFISTVSRTLGKISPKIQLAFRELDKFETQMLKSKSDLIKPFAKMYKSMSADSKQLAKRYLANGDFIQARNLFKKIDPNGGKYFDDVEKMLNKTFKELKDSKFRISKVINYFPRSIKDLDGLRASLGREQKDAIEKLIDIRKKELSTKEKKVTELSQAEEDTVINNYLRGLTRDGVGGAWKKNRTLARLDDNLLQFYDDPLDALTKYTRSTTNNLSRYKFFNGVKDKNSRGSAVTEGELLDVEGSIGSLVNTLKGTVADSDLRLLREAVQARLIDGTKSGHKASQVLKNLGYITTLANPLSALVQLGDLPMSIRVNGLRNSLAALVGRKKVSMESFGLEKALAELNTPEKLSGALDALFSVSLFKAVDRLGKNTFLNASLKKGMKLSKSDKGIKKLKEKYGDAYGDRFNNLVDDLKAGNMSEDVKLYLWSELADVQPIGLSEYPLKYLQNPNGRMFYSLKSYAIKQLDFVRNTVFDEFNKGNYAKAGKNAVLYAALIPTGNTAVGVAKDALLQRPMDLPEELQERYAENFFKVFGGSTYLARKAGKGKIFESAADVVLPPLDYIDHVYNVVQTTAVKAAGEKAEYDPKILNSMPVAGRFMYNFFGGGLEKYVETKRKEELKDIRERFYGD
jgi:hypothetical protein